MILVTHGMVGGVIGAATGSLPAAVIGGFVSHYVLDAIPHWDYPLDSVDGNAGDGTTKISEEGINKKDIAKVMTDGLLGLFVPLLIARFLQLDLLLVFLGAGFAIVPDFLTFVYLKTRTSVLKSLTWFHIDFLQSKWRLDGRPVLGLFLQSFFWVLSLLIFLSLE